MSGHIRFDKDLENDPRVFRLADLLLAAVETDSQPARQSDVLRNACRNAVLGSLLTLWGYADTHIRSDNTLPIALHHLAHVTRLPVTVLREFPPEWLVVGRDDTVILPEYVDKNALDAKEKRRNQARDRVKRWREKRNAKSNALHVTQSNARNAPSRAPTRARAPAQTETETETKGREEGAPVLRAGPEVRDEGLEAWRDVTGIHAPTIERWLRYLESLPNPKHMAGIVRIAMAKQLAGFGNAEVQSRTVEQCIANGWRNLRELQVNGHGIRKPGEKSPGDRASDDAAELRVLREGRSARGLSDFRDPYPVESAAAYATALRVEENRRGAKVGAPRFPTQRKEGQQ